VSATGSISVPACDLPTFLARHQIPRVDLLKVDIEGAEIELFGAIPDALLRDIPQIALEGHDFLGAVAKADLKALRRRLESLGFLWIAFSLRSAFDVLCLQRAMLPVSHRVLLPLSPLLRRLTRVAAARRPAVPAT
jgi:hypothetical protein